MSYHLVPERNAQTSIDWKHHKKKGLGLVTHAGNQLPFEAKGQPELSVLQQHPKTTSGRPTTKKLAAQAIVDRIQKNQAQGMQLQSLHPSSVATSQNI